MFIQQRVQILELGGFAVGSEVTAEKEAFLEG